MVSRARARDGGTLLLKPGQDPIAVLGEAWAKLRYADQVLTGYRQLINVGYVNPQDNRMVPNTFEAAMLDGQGWLARAGIQPGAWVGAVLGWMRGERRGGSRWAARAIRSKCP